MNCNEIMGFIILSDFNESRFVYGFLILKLHNVLFKVFHSESHYSIMLGKPSLGALGWLVGGAFDS